MDRVELLRNNIRTENVATYGNAIMAHASAKRGKKYYTQIISFEKNKVENLHKLVDEIANGTYRTSGYTMGTVEEHGKVRIIAKVPYRDRVAQWMIAIWYEPYFQEIICDKTHAAIRGRGIHSALHQVEHYVRVDKYKYCLETDIRKYFPHVDRQTLIGMLREDFKDDNLFKIVSNIILDAPDSVADDLGNIIENGIPIGNYWSQYMANRYMVGLNEWMIENGIVFTQYMDDIKIFSNDKQKLRRIYLDLEWELAKTLQLEIKSNWQIFPVTRGVDFVGYRIFPDKTTLRRANFLKMRRKMSKVLKRLQSGGTMTDHMTFSMMSYLGVVCHCTPRTKSYIFDTIFKPIIELSNIELSPKLRKYYGN